MNFLAIIPARRHSLRLPDKPLLDIAGAPMVVRTAQQAARSKAGRVVVATDDPYIQSIVIDHGFEAILTRSDHPTGTDRLAEVTQTLRLPPDSIIVNVQGDEPLIDPEAINAVATLLTRTPSAAIATCACPLTDAKSLFDPNVVKVVCSTLGHALYFSRAPIPWARDALAARPGILAPGLPALHHIGLYAYRTAFLQQFPALPSGALEKFEALEQLRALENGFPIVVQYVNAPLAPGVDTHDDLEHVREVWSNRL